MRKIGGVLCVAAFVAGLPALLTAQSKDFNPNDIPIRASRYIIGTEDQLLMPLNIIGFVNKPGQYIVPTQTDLISLVAYAGGFREDVRLDNVKIIRKPLKGVRGRVLEINLKKYMKTGDQRLIPTLRPDDTIIIDGSKSRAVKKFVDFVARMLVFAQFYFYIKVASDR